MQEGRPAERLRGVRDVVPVVDAALESTPVPVDRDRLAFADFYRATFTEMTRLAFLLTGSAETARDLVQDSFVRLHEKWDGVAEPRAYLRRTVVNACHSHYRRLRLQRQRRHSPTWQVDVVDLDGWLADFSTCDFAYLRNFYEKGEKLDFRSFWKHGTTPLEPLPIPNFTPERWKTRWDGIVI